MQVGQLVALQGRRSENELTSTVPLEPQYGELHLRHGQKLCLHLTPDSAYLDATQLTSAQRSCLKLQYVHVQSDALGINVSGLFLPKPHEGTIALPEKALLARLHSKFGYRAVHPPKEIQYTVFINVLDTPRPVFSSLTYSDHNALLIFPNERPSPKTIWINYNEMGKISSYFTKLFEAGFLESENILPSIRVCPAALRGDINNIVQIYRSKSQERATAEDSGIGMDPMELDMDSFFDDDDGSVSQEVPGVRYAVIDDTSYAVYRAVVTWVLTGKIRFSPLSSRKNGTSQPASAPTREGDFQYLLLRKTAPCSPTEVYELAHKLEMPSLCELALQNYEMQLDDSNFLKELFSYYAALYIEIQKTGLRVLERYSKKVVAAGGLKEARAFALAGDIDSQYALELFYQIAELLAAKAFPSLNFPKLAILDSNH